MQPTVSSLLVEERSENAAYSVSIHWSNNDMRVQPTASPFICKREIRERGLRHLHSFLKGIRENAAYVYSFIGRREIRECSLQRLYSLVKERYEGAAYSVFIHL
jgi:hypothetical protein